MEVLSGENTLSKLSSKSGLSPPAWQSLNKKFHEIDFTENICMYVCLPSDFSPSMPTTTICSPHFNWTFIIPCSRQNGFKFPGFRA